MSVRVRPDINHRHFCRLNTEPVAGFRSPNSSGPKVGIGSARSTVRGPFHTKILTQPVIVLRTWAKIM